MMRHKIKQFSNFSLAIRTKSTCFRPDNEWQIREIFSEAQHQGILARGHGLSYSDCCVHDQGIIIDTSRLNHLISFDPESGIAVCQAAATFADLFLIDPNFIPPVLPGTLWATLAGGVANDVHGKNNHIAGCLGRHITWLELQIGNQALSCHPNENQELYFATIAGLGLTGVIKRVGIRLQKASRFVRKQTETHTEFIGLLERMQEEGVRHDYQVAWLDWLNNPRAILSFADHREPREYHLNSIKPKSKLTIPKWPIRLLTPWLIKQFNLIYYHHAHTHPQHIPLWQFNNPLDGVCNWNYLYGKQGLLQFQAVFDANHADQILDQCYAIIQSHRASPTLAVLKYFTQAGSGLLSFVKPGFTLAIDFIHNQPARQAIGALNQFVAKSGGKIYLAKDLLLTRKQFTTMYPRHEDFSKVMIKYHSPMRSELGKRLGLTR